MSNVRILDQSYILESNVVAYSATDEEQGFEASNLFSDVRRSRVWRAGGRFEVTAANNTIVFNDSGGTKTATISPTVKTSLGTLVISIANAMDAVSVDDITVTADFNTYKLTISSDGGTFELLWTDANTTAAALLGFDDSADSTGATSYEADFPTIHTGDRVVFDLGTASNPTAAVIIGLRNRPIKLTSNAVVKIEGNHTDTWNSPVYSVTIPYDPYAMVVFDDGGLFPGGLRYWSIYVSDPQNGLGYIELSNVYIGEYYAPTRGAVQFPLVDESIDYTQQQVGEGGQMVASKKQKTKRLSLDWYGLTNAEKERLEQTWEEYGLALPFFIHVDPDAAFSATDANRYLLNVRFQNPLQRRLESPGNWSAQTDLIEEI